MGSHFVEVCEYGYRHSQCRCMGPKSVKSVNCDTPSHAESPKVDGAEASALASNDSITVIDTAPAVSTGLSFIDDAVSVSLSPKDVVSIPKDVSEYVTGPFKASPLTKEIWETLISGVVKDQAPNMAQALDWLHEQYGDWEN